MSTTTLGQFRGRHSSARASGGPTSIWSQHWPDALAISTLVGFMLLVMSARFDDSAVLHDMGTLGHAAERVLLGQLPHADFDDPYTGLLSLWNALSFQLFGISVLSARVSLLICTTISFVALYGFCRRTLSVWASTVIVGAAFTASVPNYFTPMPTWYNLFATIGAVAAMLRFATTEQRRWLLAAGACAGLSFLFKSVGFYTVAAAALFAIFHEQERSEARGSKQMLSPSAASPLASWGTIAGLWIFAACVFSLVSSNLAIAELTTFLAPSLVLVVYLTCNEYRLRFHGAGERLRLLAVEGAVFAAGFVAVVGAFLTPYALRGKLWAWYEGVFVRPLVRLEDELMGRPLELESFLGGAFLMALAAMGIAIVRYDRRTGRAVAVTAVIVAAVLLALSGEPAVYSAMWSFARLLPLAASAGLCLLLWSRHQTDGRKRNSKQDHPTQGRSKQGHSMQGHSNQSRPTQGRPTPDRPLVNEEVFLLVATATVFSLVQIPLAHGIYFLYAVPFVLVAAAQVLKAQLSGEGGVGLLAAGVALFAVCWVIPGHFGSFGFKYVPAVDTAHFLGTRCPTSCDPITAQQYAELVQEVRSRTAKDAPILAFPDSPDVYFMTGRRNVTRTFFDALDPDYGTPHRERRLLRTIEANKIDVVVVRNLVEFSHDGVSESLTDELRRRFPHAKEITGGVFPRFTILWRDRPQRSTKEPLTAMAGK